MATGRTLDRWTAVYVGGTAVEALTQSVGPLVTQFNAAPMQALSDGVQGGFNTHPNITPTTINAIIDSNALGSDYFTGSSFVGASRVVTIAQGIRGTVAAGDPIFTGTWYQDTASADLGMDTSAFNVNFGDYDVNSMIDYRNPWGNLLHASAAATGANTSGTGVQSLTEAATTYGGYMVYHVFAGNGTATITVEHSTEEVNGSYAALDGCTSGEIDFSTPTSGIVETAARTTTVNEYTRWQISLNGATTVTFVLGFVRMYSAW